MKPNRGWKIIEFETIAQPVAAKPGGESPLRCVELENIGQGSGRLLGTRQGMSNEGSKLSFRRGDVLFGKLRPYLRKSWHATFDGMCSSEFWVLRANRQECLPSFLHHLTLSDNFLKATHAASGSKMPRADWFMVSSSPFLLPPILEQKKISDILCTWDIALEKLDFLIFAKERRKQALMQKLLTGKLRLRKFSKTRWPKVSLNKLLKRVFRPIEWTAKKPLSLVSLRRRQGGLFRRPDVLASDYKTQDLHELKTEDFLISKRQVSHGAWAIVTREFAGSHVSKEYAILTNNSPKNLYMPFFAWLAQMPRMVWLARVSSTGVHIEKLIFDPNVFLQNYILLPSSVDEQRAIANILDSCETELRLLRQQRDALDRQKRGLMQRLLTGKVRVKI